MFTRSTISYAQNAIAGDAMDVARSLAMSLPVMTDTMAMAV